MTTVLFYDDLFLEHKTSPGHPERPERALHAWNRLRHGGVGARCQLGHARPVHEADLLTLHSQQQVHIVERLCEHDGGLVDPDTPVSTGSFHAARLAAGAGVAAVDELIAGNAHNAFALVRPPGHHATSTKSMGFCLFNNVALAARHALDRHQLSRILIVDWDVHHGNGTQEIFYAEPRVMFFSAHRYPFYPGSGAAGETGTGPGLGYTLNLPIPYGTKPEEYRRQFAAALATAADRIKPELVFISAGFDAHRHDPIGSLDLETEDFLELGRLVLDVAKTHAQGRVISMLEGGYHLEILADCIEQHVRQLVEHSAS